MSLIHTTWILLGQKIPMFAGVFFRKSKNTGNKLQSVRKSTKGPQNLFITVLASNKCPYPSQNGKPGDGVGGAFIRE